MPDTPDTVTVDGVDWGRTEIHCPTCGEKGLFVEPGEGDYYDGPQHWCRYCGCACAIMNYGRDERPKLDDG